MAFTDIKQAIIDRFPDAVEEATEIASVPTLYVRASDLFCVCKFLKEDPEARFDYIMSFTAVDWPDRFDMVYHLYSISLKHYVTIKVKLDRETPVVASVSPIWKAANWQEREVYDMFGIDFQGHPDLTRILLEPHWEGYPLRKDYVEKQ